MPIYEFRCAGCGHVQEILLSRSSEEVVMKCEECEGEVLDRILSQVNYAMGDSAPSKDRNSTISTTARSCGQGNNCATLNLPGHSR